MISVIQRVSQARVVVGGAAGRRNRRRPAGAGVRRTRRRQAQADKLLAKILKLRIFGDEAGKMNRSVQDIQGGLLLVSQFTLAADTSGGNRPSFTNAAAAEEGRRLYDYFVAQARAAHPVVQTGEFAADMQVHLVNDGPVTIPLTVR